MSKNSEAVKRWRKNAKARMVAAFGGKCGICGYNKCDEALEFHHLNPAEKETSWGAFRGNIKNWGAIVEEMKKCVMLCSNCHKEVHSGAATIPDDIPRIDLDVVDYKAMEKTKSMDSCPICGKEKFVGNRYCSWACSGKAGRRVDWDNVDLYALIDQHGSVSAVADVLGVSEAAVRKRKKKIESVPQ